MCTLNGCSAKHGKVLHQFGFFHLSMNNNLIPLVNLSNLKITYIFQKLYLSRFPFRAQLSFFLYA